MPEVASDPEAIFPERFEAVLQQVEPGGWRRRWLLGRSDDRRIPDASGAL
jgi:hypothetical protein